MGFLTGKTAIITGAGRAVLSDGRCGSIGYGIATAYAKEGDVMKQSLPLQRKNLKDFTISRFLQSRLMSTLLQTTKQLLQML